MIDIVSFILQFFFTIYEHNLVELKSKFIYLNLVYEFVVHSQTIDAVTMILFYNQIIIVNKYETLNIYLYDEMMV